MTLGQRDHVTIGTAQLRYALLGDVCKTTSGGTPSRANPAYFEGKIPWVKSGELPDGPVAEIEETITEAALANSSAKLFPAGTLLIALYGATVGKLGVLTRDAATNQAVCAVFPSSVLEQKYLFWFLRFKRRALIESAIGGAQPNISQGILRNLEVPLPTLDEQRVAVAEIEKQFSRLDEAVASLKRAKANLKRYKAAVLKAAVEGRLVSTEAELVRKEGRAYETGTELLQRILGTRRKVWNGKGKYKVPVACDVSDLPELPDGWTWAAVDQLASANPFSITDGPFGSNLKSSHYQDSGPRVIRLQNIKDGEFSDEYAHISTEHYASLRKHSVSAGDIVIASLGENPPRACVIPAHVGPAIVKADCIRFSPHESLTVEYLNVALNCQPTKHRVKDVLHGIGRPRLSLGEIRAIGLPIPPAAEQKRISVEVDRIVTLIRGLDSQTETNLARAERLRQSVLSRFFAG